MTALFAIGNCSTAFPILQTQDIGASLELTILTYAAFNLVAALITYPAGYNCPTNGEERTCCYCRSSSLSSLTLDLR